MTLKVGQIKADLKSCSLSAKANFHPASKSKSEPLSFCSFSSSFQIIFHRFQESSTMTTLSSFSRLVWISSSMWCMVG